MNSIKNFAFYNWAIVLLLLLNCNFALAQGGECCVCETKENTFVYHESAFCKPDFNKWLSKELTKACGTGGSSFISFAVGENGHRKVVLKEADFDWIDYVDNDIKKIIKQQEQSLAKQLSGRSSFSSTVGWLVQSVYALKTWSNVLCGCGCTMGFSETWALGDERCCIATLWGNPYYERCPHCLVRVERIIGCHSVNCPNCRKQYISRRQVECPLLVGNIGCNGCCIPVLTFADYCKCYCCTNDGCWAIGPCEACKCKVPIVVCLKGEFVCECASLKSPESEPLVKESTT